MNIDLDLLRIFKCVAYHNSLSKASKELGLTQPSISKSIKKLEEQLNLTLFVRQSKGVKLTDDGKTLYRYIFDSINHLENVKLLSSNINELETGELKIGASISIINNLLFDTIIDFKKLYPNLDLKIKNSKTEHLYDDLRYGRIDIMFANSSFNFNKKKYSHFDVTEITETFFTSKNIYEKIKNLSNINKYIFENIICQNENFDTRKYLNYICNKNDISFKPTIEVERHDLIVNLVLKDMGVGFATKEYLKEYFDKGLLYEIDTNLKLENRKVICIYRNSDSKKVKCFLNILNNYYKK